MHTAIFETDAAFLWAVLVGGTALGGWLGWLWRGRMEREERQREAWRSAMREVRRVHGITGVPHE